MTLKGQPTFSSTDFLSESGNKTISVLRKDTVVFSQGDPADAIWFIREGKIKLTVISNAGKEAVIAVLGAKDFFGEGCLAGQPFRMATATALLNCSIMRLGKVAVIEALDKDPAFAKLLLSYALSRTIRIEADLVDQLFNSSEKRLARMLLLLANFGNEGGPQKIIPKISQETLAEMIGTTRSRVSFFMNRFRRLGFIKYNGGLEVHSALLNVVLHDSPEDVAPIPGGPF
jgi:CRP-like cAMP-binding protein